MICGSMYTFPCLESDLLFQFGAVYFVMFQWSDWGCYFPHDFWFAVGSFMFFGCCGFLLSFFGHNRDKNNSGIKFPSQGCVFPVSSVVRLGLLFPHDFGLLWVLIESFWPR